jgi:hypothetical protein
MARIIDLTGQRLGMLTVLAKAGKDSSGNNLWLCQCECGKQTRPAASSLARGATRSCGCNRTPKKQDARNRQPEYKLWNRIKSRCYNEGSTQYQWYGGRGIKVCDRWLNDYEAFLSDMGRKPLGTEIDRIDNDGDYSPDNCRWSTRVEQVRNRSNTLVITADGITAPLAEHAERIGISYIACYKRWKRLGSIHR